MSHIMRKPVYAICKQQRHRSACASAVVEQAGLSQPWSQTPKTGFLVMWLILPSMLKSMLFYANNKLGH